MSNDLRELYFIVCCIPPGVALELARCAESDYERNFFAFVSDMNLQRLQWEYIHNSK